MKLIFLLVVITFFTIISSVSAANLQDCNTIANDAAFRGRCREAVTIAAANVMAESNTTTSHAQRILFAASILQGGGSDYQNALTVLSNSTIAAEATTASLPGCTAIPDSDIQFAVNSLFNAMAGIGT